MAAGTVISGGFPGRVAQEVQSNPKCSGCLHYDGQAGRTGACTIGLRPWLCGDGGAAEIGYAPIHHGAGAYLPDNTARVAQAPEVAPAFVPAMYGAGSTKAVTFQQVSLGEEHVHFVKSLVAQQMDVERQLCRLHQGSGQAYGASPYSSAPQTCTCRGPSDFQVAKALVGQLSNRQRTQLTRDELFDFVRDQSGVRWTMVKGGGVAKQSHWVSPQDGEHISHHVVAGPYGSTSRKYKTRQSARTARDKLDTKYGASTHSVWSVPHPDVAKAAAPSAPAAKSLAKSLSFSPHPESPRHHVAATSHGEYEISPSHGAGPKGTTHRLDYYPHGGGDHPSYTKHFANHGVAVQHAQTHHTSVAAVSTPGERR